MAHNHYLTTAEQYHAHIEHCRAQQGVLSCRDVESIHQGESDAFAVAHTTQGTLLIVGYQAHPLYYAFPFGACPIIEGVGYFDSVTRGLRVYEAEKECAA